LETVTENTSQRTSVVAEHLRAWNPNAIEEVIEFRGETTIVLPRKILRAAAERCRDHADLQFNLLTDATCVDRYPHELRLRVRLSGSDAVVDTLVPVWPGANWLEREIFDLFGIRFTGHPDLRRILLPEDWEGYPLRKDYPVEGYRDVPMVPGFRKSSV
jgi:NADH-quinone oxidoreductase subunit C